MDILDRKLILELQVNGRASFQQMARKLGVVEGTIRKRVKNLINHDVIRIAAIPNMRKFDYGFISIVGLQVRMDKLREVADKLKHNPHICYLAFVAGRFDLMAVVLTQSQEELSEFIEKDISVITSIIRTETFVNLDAIKGAWPMFETRQLIESINSTATSKEYV